MIKNIKMFLNSQKTIDKYPKRNYYVYNKHNNV